MAQGERTYYDDVEARENPEKMIFRQNSEPGAIIGYPQEVALAAVQAADTAQAAADAAQASANAAAALAASGVKPLMFYNFGQGSDQGCALANCSAADQDFSTARRYAANAVNPTLAVSGLSLAVADVNVVAVRLRLVSGTQGDGRLYYGNALHSVVDPYYANVGNLPVGVWTVLLFDFRTLADFMLNGPTSALALRFGAAADLVVDIDWIALGQYGAVSQESVNAAQADATEALGLISDMASDSLLSPVEKPALIKEMEANDAEYQGICDAGTAFGNATELVAFQAAKTALDTYLAGLTTPVAWNVLAGNTTIVAATFRQKFTDFYTARQVLLNKNADTARLNAVAAYDRAAEASTDAQAAQSTATVAQTLASNKNATFRANAPPTNPISGYTLREGDLWYNLDITTNCADANCKGHTLDANGAPNVGAYPHRGTYWAHVWNGTAWVDADRKAKIIAEELEANVIKTPNYTYGGTLGEASEYATAGAKMQNTANGVALLVAPGNLKVGTELFSGIPILMKAYRGGSAQVVSSGYESTIIFNYEIIDSADAYNTSTGKFTVPTGKAGHYLVMATVSVSAASTGTSITLRLYQGTSGAGWVARTEYTWDSPVAGEYKVLQFASFLPGVAAGEELYVTLDNNTPGNATITHGSGQRSRFEVWRVQLA